MTITEQVLSDIADERKAVRGEIASEETDDGLFDSEWGALLLRHAGLAMPHVTGENRDTTTEKRFYRQMIRVAWLAIAAAESVRRRTEAKPS